MVKFITIRCRSCNSVICNLPEKDINKGKLINVTCEDCIDQDILVNFKTGISR